MGLDDRRSSFPHRVEPIVVGAVLGIVLAALPPSARAEEGTTAVLPAAGQGEIAERYVKRAQRSLRKAIKTLDAVSMAPGEGIGNAAACAVDTACVARAGTAAGAARAVGVLLARKDKGFELSLLLVESTSGRELARKTYAIAKSRGLRKQPGARLKELLARVKAPAPAPDRPPEPKEPPRPRPQLQERQTLLVYPSAEGKIPARYVTRVFASLRKAAKKLKRVEVARKPASRKCAASPECVAAQGTAAKTARAIGVTLSRARRGFALRFTVVDVATGHVLSRSRYTARNSRALRTVPGARLRDILAPGPGDSSAPAGSWKPLRARAAGKARGDGRTVIPIAVADGPPLGPGELRAAPEQPFVWCERATSLPAMGKTPPAIIAPPVDRPTTLTCLVRRRGAESEFRVKVSPPPAGLYASAPPRVRAQDPPIAMRAIVKDRHGSRPPKRLRASASGGLVRVRTGGEMRLELPPGKAPRMIVVALADGKRAGAAFVPVRGVSKLKVQAERRATVRVRIGGEWSGPITARKGVAWVPIEAPPGVQRAVLRATDRAGYATESIADLGVPALPRLAAVAANAQLSIGESTQIVVAVAAANGRPSGSDTHVVASAKRGEVGEPRARGSGVWVVAYTSAKAPGQDEVVVRIEGDPRAGAVVLPLVTTTGSASRVSVSLPDGPFGPGDEIAGTVVIRDANGNRIPDADVSAALGRAPVAVERSKEGIVLRARVPDQLPDSGVLLLFVTSGDSTTSHPVRTRAGEPVTAKMLVRRAPLSARLRVEVRDRHGNLVGSDAFRLRVEGARIGPLERREGEYRAELTALGGQRRAVVHVEAGERTLLTQEVRLGPPHAITLGAYAEGGWVSDFGDLSGPRAGAGLGIERSVGTVDLSARLGFEGLHSTGRGQMRTGLEGSWSLTGMSIPVFVRFRVRLWRGAGVVGGVGIAPTRVSVETRPDAQEPDRYAEFVLATRWQLAFDAPLGPGRLLVGGAFGTGRLSDGAVTGRIEGLGAFAGYEWWFADLNQ